MKFRFGLLPRVVLAIGLGVGCGFFFPEWATRIALTFNDIFGQFLSFVIPLLILGLVAPGIADLWDGRVMCYAVTASFVVFLIFASLWWPRAWIFIAISGIVWGAALSVFVTFSGISGGGVIFALAGVLELPVLLCYFWRCSARHQWLIPYPFPRKK